MQPLLYRLLMELEFPSSAPGRAKLRILISKNSLKYPLEERSTVRAFALITASMIMTIIMQPVRLPKRAVAAKPLD